jgi:hypothetical protein
MISKLFIKLNKEKIKFFFFKFGFTINKFHIKS